MNNDIQAFDFWGLPIRKTFDGQGNPLWVAKDVCEAFGDTNYRRSVARLDSDKKGVSLIETPGGKQRMTVVTEPGLYSLLFGMSPSKARMKDAKVAQRVQMLEAFMDWVCGEVLPSIRKHGAYFAPKTIDDWLADPDAAITALQAYKGDRVHRTHTIRC